MRRVANEMRDLLGDERPDMLVSEVRKLARDTGLELPEGAGIEQAHSLAESYVDSDEFEQLDEGVREAWRWVLRALEKTAHVAGKTAVAAATVGAKVVAGALNTTNGLLRFAMHGKSALKTGSTALLSGDEPFTIGDVGFRPMNANRWKAVLPGRYKMIVKHRPKQGTFTCSLEGQPVGGQWDDDDLAYAVQMAFAMIADEPEEDDPRLGRL